jgi:hypothetical protein
MAFVLRGGVTNHALKVVFGMTASNGNGGADGGLEQQSRPSSLRFTTK